MENTGYILYSGIFLIIYAMQICQSFYMLVIGLFVFQYLCILK